MHCPLPDWVSIDMLYLTNYVCRQKIRLKQSTCTTISFLPINKIVTKKKYAESQKKLITPF